MILTLVAMLSMTTAFAEGENAASVNTLEAYELNVTPHVCIRADVRCTVQQRRSQGSCEPRHRERCEVDALCAQRQADAYLSHTAQHDHQQSWTEQVRELVISSMISVGDVP